MFAMWPYYQPVCAISNRIEWYRCILTCWKKCYVSYKLSKIHPLRLDNIIITFTVPYTYHHIIIFVLSKHSLNRNQIRDKGGVALGEALKVNKTLQTLR